MMPIAAMTAGVFMFKLSSFVAGTVSSLSAATVARVETAIFPKTYLEGEQRLAENRASGQAAKSVSPPRQSPRAHSPKLERRFLWHRLRKPPIA